MHEKMIENKLKIIFSKVINRKFNVVYWLKNRIKNLKILHILLNKPAGTSKWILIGFSLELSLIVTYHLGFFGIWCWM